MIITAQHCISCDPFFDKFVLSESRMGVIYLVRISYPDDPPDEWTCTCPSFAYRGRCKHINTVAAEGICHWHEMIGPENQTDQQKHDHICPRCGNMTVEELEESETK